MRKLISRSKVDQLFWLRVHSKKELRGRTGRTERSFGAKIRESLNIGNLLPFTRSLAILVKIPHNNGIKTPLGSHLESNRYHSQVWLQRYMSLDIFKSGARYKGLRFSKRHLNKELENIVKDPVPMVRKGVMPEPRPHVGIEPSWYELTSQVAMRLGRDHGKVPEETWFT